MSSGETRRRGRAIGALGALALVAACSSDGPVRPPADVECDGATIAVRNLDPGDGVTIDGAAIGCVALAGAGARYLVAPQLTGPSLPYGGYGFRLGDPEAIAAGSGALRLAESAALPWLRSSDPADAQHRLDALLRDRERSLPRPSGRARTVRSPVDAGRPDAPQAADPLRTFSVLNSLDATPRFSAVAAALAFEGATVLLYLDTVANAAFAPAELAALGQLLDGQLIPAMHGQFGRGSDIDANGRVVFLLTPTVNAMVTAAECATSGFVRGFFYGHDLTSDAPTSNRGEVFYAYVPDPTGRWSCAHGKSDVLANLAPTFMHELQHMISFGEHAIARGGPSEEPWLNEGLSHIAEELGARVFEARYPPPTGRSVATQIFPDSASPYITPNLLYSYRFLLNSGFYSLTTCAPGTFCSLSERGGAWLLLRYIADQRGESVLRQLVETPLAGRANLEAVTGRSTAAWLGDFALAVSADSIEGRPRSSTSPLRFQSRNLRRLYKALFDAYGLAGGVGRPFPIAPLELPASGSFVTGTIRPGTFATYRVTAGSGDAVLRLGLFGADAQPFAASAGAQLSILRLP